MLGFFFGVFLVRFLIYFDWFETLSFFLNLWSNNSINCIYHFSFFKLIFVYQIILFQNYCLKDNEMIPLRMQIKKKKE